MKRITVNVFVSCKLAGAISRSELEDDIFLFSYNPKCMENDVVSLTMPVIPDQYDSMNTIPGISDGMQTPRHAGLLTVQVKSGKKYSAICNRHYCRAGWGDVYFRHEETADWDFHLQQNPGRWVLLRR
ncbi:MAG: hypothetical protein WA705_05640 [Candidatus Ozemobacteraceae bacterium]